MDAHQDLQQFQKKFPDAIHDRFREIRGQLEETLRDHIQKKSSTWRKEKNKATAALRLMAMGTSEENVCPYLGVFTSNQELAKQYLEQPRVKEEYQPQNSWQPSFKLYFGPPPDTPSPTDGKVLIPQADGYFLLTSNTYCGAPVTIRLVSGAENRATFGGIVKVTYADGASKLYGITAGHALWFSEGFLSPDISGEPSKESDVLEVSDPVTPTVWSSYTLGQIGSISKDHPSLQASEASAYSDWLLFDMMSYMPNLLQTGASTAGIAATTSATTSTTQLNLAELLMPPSTADCLRRQSSVHVITAAGLKPGRLSGLPSRLLLGEKEFVDTLIVDLDDGNEIVTGDSGSWVVDQKTRQVYGYIVAVDVLGSGYVVPLNDIFQDMSTRLGADLVVLASAADIELQKRTDVETTRPKVPPNEYSYRRICPLDEPSEDIRVIDIIGDKSGILHCKLTSHKHIEAKGFELNYNALSWSWGFSGHDQAHIIIEHETESYPFPVSAHLEAALKQLWKNQVRRLWVDFICIDQSDPQEMQYQIALMPTILSKAKCVDIWLGIDDGSKSGRRAIKFLKNKVLDLPGFSSHFGYGKLKKEWAALEVLTKNRWFSRRWVIQDVVLAERANLMCGSHQIEWGDFADALSLLKDVWTMGTVILPDDASFISDSHAMRLVEITNNSSARLPNGRKELRLSLMDLVVSARDFSATQPRDTIYALLNIAKDTVRREEKTTQITHEFSVDYSRPTSRVYAEFVSFAIRRADPTRALDILLRPWAPSQSGKLPSWILTEKVESFGKDGLTQKTARKNADSLVGLFSWQCNYSASGGRPVGKFVLLDRQDVPESKDTTASNVWDNIIVVEGFVLDGIQHLEEPARLGNIPHSWLTRGSEGGGEDRFTESFLRTLVADRKSGRAPPPPYYPRLISHGLKLGVKGDTLNTERIIYESDDGMIRNIFKEIQATIWNRRLALTQGSAEVSGWANPVPRFGLVPDNTRMGDIICILYGCSVPVVLRPCGKISGQVQDQGLGSYYTFIGECYIDGMMDGEAVQLPNVKERSFELR